MKKNIGILLAILVFASCHTAPVHTKQSPTFVFPDMMYSISDTYIITQVILDTMGNQDSIYFSRK